MKTKGCKTTRYRDLTTKSAMYCTSYCVKDDKCKSINFNKVTKECEINKSMSTVSTTNVTFDAMFVHAERLPTYDPSPST